MARLSKAQQLENLKAKKAALEARLQKLQAADQAEARKKDARRKIVLGAFLERQILKDTAVAKMVIERLPGFLERPLDKELFAPLIDGWREDIEEKEKQPNS